MNFTRWLAQSTSVRRFFLIALSLAELFVFAGIAQGASSIDDDFAGSALDWCRWEDVSYNGTVTQSSALSLSPSGTQQYTSAEIVSQARLLGDFDVQVGYRFGSGLAQSPASGGLNIALAIYWDEARRVTLARTRLANGDGITAYSTVPESAPNNSLFTSELSQAGALRLVRIGKQLNFYFRASAAVQWTSLGTMTIQATAVHIALSAFNSGTQQGFTGYLDSFKLNAGSTDDIDYAQPTSFNKREEFAVAAFTENYPVQRYWRGAWKPVDFFDAAAKNGFNWAKTTVGMLSAPELAATPPGQWGTLAWQNRFWSSREWAAETIRQAAARGLRQEVQLTLSQGAAYWGYQNAPPDWANKTPAEIVPLLEQNVFDTVAYLKGQGLNVERYAIGNEVDIGILDFLPNRRIAVPAGVNFTSDLVWLRNAVWPTEAMLLTAAAAGIKRADPAAKIILHIAGLEFTHGNVFAPAFFEAMRDLGVPFDYAALSHPYAYSPWKLDHYSKACWFKRLALTTDRISAITGKPLMFVEASYPSAPGSGIVAAPMPDFPFTETGQAAWIREQLRFASSRQNIVGWHYFYPDMAANVISATPEEQPLANNALFVTDQQPKPALAEFLVNLASLPSTAANYSDLWWGGTAQNGWGMTVQQHGNTQFNVFFVYDGAGKPIWYAMPGGTWNSNFTVFSGGIAKPTSAPLNAYDKSLFQPGGQVGTMAITYTSLNTAQLNYTIGGVSGQKNIQRQIFGQSDGTTGLTVGDMWWAGAAQDGWGVSITQQLRSLFAAWYTYDQNGNVTWYTLPGGAWSGNTYSGVLATATSSPWLGGTYNPAAFTPAAMGTVSFTFSNANNAVMSYTFTAGPFAGTTQTKQLVRQAY